MESIPGTGRGAKPSRPVFRRNVSRFGNGNGGLKLADWSPQVDISRGRQGIPHQSRPAGDEEGRDQGATSRTAFSRSRANAKPRRKKRTRSSIASSAATAIRAQLHCAGGCRWREGFGRIQGRRAESAPAEKSGREAEGNRREGGLGRGGPAREQNVARRNCRD